MKFLTGKPAITPYNQQSIIYDAEIIDLHPEPINGIDLFKCPTAEDIAQAGRDLEAHKKLSYWDWLKSVLG